MAYIAKLEWGAASLNINDGSRYKIRTDFTPPATAVTAFYAAGTNANQYQGAAKVGSKAQNVFWSFTISCRGATDNEVNRAVGDLTNFLSHAGDEATPLYFAFRGNSNIAAEPTWGQFGVNYRYEIVHAETPEITPTYNRGIVIKDWYDVVFNVMIKPFALGKRQRLSNAAGGILQDTIATTNGRARGTSIPEATTNIFTNPIFGHGTFNNGWTDGADIDTIELTDPDDVLFGSSSALVVAVGGTTLTFTQSINAGKTDPQTITCYAKKRDGTAVSSADGAIYYGASQTTTYTQVGNSEWYRLEAEVTGVASATATGIVLAGVGTHLIVDGFQMEDSDYSTPLAHGDMLGVAWSGTAHASTSVRTAAVNVLTVPGNLRAEWTIRAVWTADKVHSDFGANGVVFSNGSIELRWAQASTLWRLTDGTNNADTAADTISIGETFVFHAVGSADGLVLYINGVSAATNSTYTPPTLTNLYIGCGTLTTLHLGGLFRDFAIYDVALTAAEALADYTDLTQLPADDDSVGYLPWLWTKDGDGVVDNANDSAKDNFCIIHGVAGDVDAVTRFVCTTSANLSSAPVWLSKYDAPVFFSAGEVYAEHDGTADVGASSNDAYNSFTVTTSETSKTGGDIDGVLRYLGGRTFRLFARFYDAGSNMQIQAGYAMDSSSTVEADYKPISATTAFNLFYTEPLQLVNVQRALLDGDAVLVTGGHYFFLNMKRTTGSAAARLDYVVTMFEPTIKIDGDTLGGAYSSFVLDSETGNYLYVPAGGLNFPGIITNGTNPALTPDRYNTIIYVQGDSDAAATITYTLTYNKVQVTPRWRLLQ